MNEIQTKDTKIAFRNKGLSQKSLNAYSNALQKYIAYQVGREESPENLKAFFLEVRESVKPRFYNLIRQSVKEYLLEKYKLDFEAITFINQAFKNIKRAKVNQSIGQDKYWSKEKVYQLAGKVTPRLSCLIQFSFFSSLRISEMLSVRKEDIDIQGDIAYIYVRQAKGGKDYKTFCSTKLIEKIQSIYTGDNDLLFFSKSGKALNRCNLHSQLNKQSVKYGFGKIGFHKIGRHSKAYYLKHDRHLDVSEIAQCLNHSNINTTINFYFHSEVSPSLAGVYDLEVI